MNKNPFFSLYLLKIILIIFTFISRTTPQPTQYPKVTEALATRSMRYHHLLFHNLRNNWNRLDNISQALIRSYGWEPPRPAKDANGKFIIENTSGEDFLYMHRQMKEIRNKLNALYGQPNVPGFVEIPAADDPDYPMPPSYTAPTEQLSKLVIYYKSDDWYTYLKGEEAKLKDPVFLRNMTLGELGAYIEWTSDIHQGMHFRFSAVNSLMRPVASQQLPYINKTYDVPSSDWLVDLYSSQVNPWFWKMHLWIDDRIDDWQAAHNLTSIQWNGTWTGGSLSMLPKQFDLSDDPDVRFLGKEDHASHDGMNMSTEDLEVMEKVFKVLAETGVQCDYYGELEAS